MPIYINPGTTAPSDYAVPVPRDWISEVPFSFEQAQQNIAPDRPGTVAGGMSLDQARTWFNPDAYRTTVTQPALSSPAKAIGLFGKAGVLTLDEIDPFATLDQLPSALGLTGRSDTGQFGQAGPGSDILGFLSQKGIDPFGQGATGAPARLADYALSWPLAVIRGLSGQVPQQLKQDLNGMAGLKYKFQRDPGYWLAVGTFDPKALDALASQVASAYGVEPNPDNYLVRALRQQFEMDRQIANGWTSGSEQIDYLAKLSFTRDYIGAHIDELPQDQRYDALMRASNLHTLASIVSSLPFIGQSIANAAFTAPPKIEDAWRALSAKERQTYFSSAGPAAMAGSLVAWLPLLSGVGAVLSAVKGAGTIATFGSHALTGERIYQTYAAILKASEISMATGLTFATVNWGMEAFSPWYSERIGQQADAARPVSGSNLAGLVNNIGFWSSGTFGARLAQKTIFRGAETVVGATAGKIINIGEREAVYYRTVYGGSQMANQVARALPDQFRGMVELAPKVNLMQFVTNYAEKILRDGLAAAAKGEKTGIAMFDTLGSVAEKVEMANQVLMRFPQEIHAQAEALFRLLHLRDAPEPLLAGSRSANPIIRVLDKLAVDDARRTWQVGRNMARWLDDDMARVHISEYGDAWLAQRAGSTTVAALEAEARKTVGRLGGDVAAIGSHNAEGWAQMLRYLHAVEFTKRNAELAAAVERLGSAGKPAEEAGRVTIMRADHLFADQVDAALGKLRGQNASEAAAERTRILTGTDEGRRWFREEFTPRAIRRNELGTPDMVPPERVAEFVESIKDALPLRRLNAKPTDPTFMDPLNQLQAEIDRDGLFAIAFKPVDEAGNFISYVRMADGAVFKSPFLDYPITAHPNIQLGNRGILLAKLDGITRGFRTWRIAEMQHASLFRSMTGRYKVTPEQVDAFYEGVLKIARSWEMQAQTVGAIARGRIGQIGSLTMQEQINKLATSIFGSTKLRSLATGELVEVDWADVIARSYRQSMRLNLTAGLTSAIKAMIPGSAGASVAWASDIFYVMYRFNLSGVFKGGELLESAQFNAMRMGFDTVSPEAAALYYRHGIGNAGEAFTAEMTLDPQLIGTAGIGRDALETAASQAGTPAQRQAASIAFLARALPDTLEARRLAASHTAASTENQAAHAGGNVPTAPSPLAEPWDGAGYRMPAEGASWANTRPNPRVVREGDLPDTHTKDPGEFADEYADPDLLPDERGMWHATTEIDLIHREGLKSRQETGRAGLGGGEGYDRGTHVSVTTNYAHAEAIAERMRIAARAARNEISGPDIIDHFAALYGDESVVGYGLDRMAKELGITSDAIVTRVGHLEAQGRFDEAVAVLRQWANRNLRTAPAKYQAVQNLDMMLPSAREGEFLGQVGLTLTVDRMARVNPDQIGIVQVAAKKGEVAVPWSSRLDSPAASASVRHGPDPFELQFSSDRLIVVDDRPMLPPLADTEEDLLAQLQAVLAPGPKPGQRTMLDDMVGGNGVLPGMDGRAADILARIDYLRNTKLDDGPVFKWADAPAAEREAFLRRLSDEGGHPADAGVGGPTAWTDPGPGPVSPEAGSPYAVTIRKVGEPAAAAPGAYARRNPFNGQPETATLDDIYAASQRRSGAANDLADVAGTPEAFFDRAIPQLAEEQAAAAGGKKDGWWETFWHPAKYKLEKANRLQVEMFRRDFPRLLDLAGLDGVKRVFQELGIPQHQWGEFLMKDRDLYARWMASGTADDFAKMIAHAGPEDAATRQALDAMYKSEDWSVLMALWSVNARVTQQEAFGVHFFAPYRSALERSINHPLLGIYPASWSYKTAKEWAKFLYDNRLFGHGALRLGMAPAQAIGQIQRAQAAAFAQTNPDTLDHYLEKGPLGSPLFIFNLLLPGDWSAIPFPASRTIRDFIRPVLAGKDLPNAGEAMVKQLGSMGAGRDARLYFESAGAGWDLAKLAMGMKDPDPVKALRGYSIPADWADAGYHMTAR